MNRKTKWILVILAFIILIFISFLIRGKASAHNDDSITVCHKTHSETNPWVEQIINANELESHLANGDFVVNSDHPCPPVTPTPTIKSTSTPTPTPKPKNCGNEEVYIPCPSPTPTASPSATPTPSIASPSASTGGSGGNGGNNPPPIAQCKTDAFVGPVIVSFTNKGHGTVNFAWKEITGGINKYSIVYGYSPNALVFGQDNIPGNVWNWDIHQLNPGNHVWAKVTAWLNNCGVESNLFDPIVK